jgi:uncharacterized protein YjbJ (UPF0337 family)
MNEDIIKGKWKQIRGRLKETWGRLTDDDLARLDGDRDYVIGKVQEHYGHNRERAEQLVRDFERSL